MTAIPARRPEPGTPRPYHFPRAESRALASGARVVVAQLPRLPLVTLTAVFHRAGATSDPTEQTGIAQLTATLLLEGTTTLDGVTLAEHFEALGTTVTARAEWDATTLSLTVQPERLEAAVALLRDVLQSPAFPQREFDRLRAEHDSLRLQLLSEPQALADSAFVWTCYDSGSRFSRPLGGTRASIAALSVDDIRDYWRRRYTPSALTVVVAGDVTVAGGASVAELIATGFPTHTADDVPLSTKPRCETAAVHLVEKPDAAQCELRIGHVGVPRVHPDFFPLTVMNAVLGGLFSSRINLNLRERNGYTYGASSQFDWRRGPGPWLVSTAVNSEVVGAATKETLSEIGRIRTSTIAADELSLATSYLGGVFPLRFETTGAVASALTSRAIFGLGDRYFDEYRDRIAAVTVDDIRRVAETHLRPDRIQVVAVGDPTLLRPQLDALEWGIVHRYAPEHVERAP